MGEYSEVRSRRWAVGRGSLLTWSPLTRFYSSVARGCLLLLYLTSRNIYLKPNSYFVKPKSYQRYLIVCY